MSDLGRTILQTRNSRFTFSQLLFGIGTLAYSILFVAYGAVPLIWGWLGLVASVFFIFANGIKLLNPDFKVLGNVGLFLGWLPALPFEAGFGVWLLFFSH